MKAPIILRFDMLKYDPTPEERNSMEACLAVIEALDPVHVDIDQIQREANLTDVQVSIGLTLLDLDDKVVRMPGSVFGLRRPK